MLSFADFPPVAPRLLGNLHALLAETDQFAFENVTHDASGQSLLDEHGAPIAHAMPRGGPFGAVLAISYPDGSLRTISSIRSNNVLASGIASQHAEDRAMQPDACEEVARQLLRHKIEHRRGAPIVWMISSAQSCPTCQTKLEIFARDLMARDLIEPDHFMCLFGASYDETYEIAHLNDAYYADALILAHDCPENEGNLVHCAQATFDEVPAAVQKIFAHVPAQTAVVMQGETVYALGDDTRKMHDPFSTAEVEALRAACRRYREEGENASWLVKGRLYTTTLSPGPLMLTEASWTGIREICSVRMPPHLQSLQRETREAPDLSNEAFLALVAEGYQHEQSVVRVFRDFGFQNRAQKMWRRISAINEKVLYNGDGVSDDVLACHEAMRFCFAPFSLDDLVCSTGAYCLPVALKPWPRSF